MPPNKRQEPSVAPEEVPSELSSIDSHLIRLRREAGSMLGRDRALLEEAVEELTVTLEEMRAADEELAHQNEKLAQSREDAETRAQRYRELFDFAPDGYLVTDTAGTIQAANRAIADMLGVSQRFLTGKPLVSFVSEGDRSRFRTGLNRVGQLPRRADWVLHLQPRERQVFPAQVRIGVLTDVGDGRPGLQWAIRDESERQLAQEARLEAEAAVKGLRDLQSLADVWLQLANEGLDALLRALLLRVRDLLGGDTATILLVTGADAHLAVRAAVGGQEEVVNQVEVPMGRGFAGRIAAEREPMIVADLSAIEVQSPFLKKRVRSLVGVPLIVEDRVIGVLHVGSAKRGRFDSGHMQLLRLVADRAAIAIENARLYESEQRARELAEEAAGRAAVLQAVTAALSEALTPSEVAGVVVDRGLPALGASAGSIGIRREDEIEVVRAVGYDEEFLEPWRRFPLDAPLPIAEAVRTGEAVFIGSKEERDARYPHLQSAGLTGGRAWAAVPLTVEGQTLGAMGLSFPETRTFRESERGLMFALARQAAQAIERARLFEAERVARDRAETAGEALAFLAEGSRLLASSLEFEPTLERVAGLAVPFLADVCVIDLVDETGSIHRVATSRADGSKEELVQALRRYPPSPGATDHPILEVLRTGSPKLLEEVPGSLRRSVASTAEQLEVLEGLGARSIMSVPLVARGRTLGAMTFVLSKEGQKYGQEQLVLAQDMAGRAALAIDNARLFRDQRHIATALQRSLLPPSLPSVPGLEVAGRYRAAGDGIEVGGDFFDLFEAGDEEWAVVIGDVCGKGPEAAAVTGLARHTLRAAAMHEQRPSRLLRILNDAILRQVREDRFCTICYARLRPNPSGTRVTLSSGGHPLPMVLRRDGSLEPAGVPGSLLGVFQEPELPTAWWTSLTARSWCSTQMAWSRPGASRPCSASSDWATCSDRVSGWMRSRSPSESRRPC